MNQDFRSQQKRFNRLKMFNRFKVFNRLEMFNRLKMSKFMQLKQLLKNGFFQSPGCRCKLCKFVHQWQVKSSHARKRISPNTKPQLPIPNGGLHDSLQALSQRLHWSTPRCQAEVVQPQVPTWQPTAPISNPLRWLVRTS